jgi:hypothetical protein
MMVRYSNVILIDSLISIPCSKNYELQIDFDGAPLS